MKLIQKIFVCSFILLSCVCNAHGDIACINQIGQDTETFLNPLKEIVGTSNLDQNFVDANKSKFFGLIAGNVLAHCAMGGDYTNLNSVADSNSIKIPFQMDDKKYDITVDTSRLFDYIELPTAILVTNDRTKVPGDVITKTEMPTDYFFSKSCSDHYVRFNLSNSASVNKAGQAAFAAYGGTENEFFLDMPVGKSCRAFPGLVLGDFGTWGGTEKIVVYTNYKEARKALKIFSNNLQNTSCANQGLAVYQVSIDNIPVEENGKTGWAIAAGVVGTPMAYLGITAGLYALGVGFGSTSVAAMTVFSGAMATASIPVAGWIVAGVAAAAMATIAFLPTDLADVDQVVVLSDPEIIR